MATLTIHIPEDLARQLAAIAQAEHSSVEAVAVERLRSALPSPGSPAALMQLLRDLPPIEPETIDELDRAIEAAKVPARTAGMF